MYMPGECRHGDTYCCGPYLSQPTVGVCRQVPRGTELAKGGFARPVHHEESSAPSSSFAAPRPCVTASYCSRSYMKGFRSVYRHYQAHHDESCRGGAGGAAVGGMGPIGVIFVDMPSIIFDVSVGSWARLLMLTASLLRASVVCVGVVVRSRVDGIAAKLAVALQADCIRRRCNRHSD